MSNITTNDDRLLDTREAAALTKRSVSALRHDRVYGKGPVYFRPPGSNRVLYRYSDLMRWIEAGRRETATNAA